jgi:hypothetical protein
MTRDQLEHVIRAACSIADVDDLIIVGSQAILGQFPDAPAELLASMEADAWPRHRRDRAALIEGSIGELSMFHETFGYYADGMTETGSRSRAGSRSRRRCASASPACRRTMQPGGASRARSTPTSTQAAEGSSAPLARRVRLPPHQSLLARVG